MSGKIELTRGLYAIVDDEDYNKLNSFCWNATERKHFSHKTYYAVRTIYETRKVVYMHRQILGVLVEQVVDHINRNGLDNRKENLRICSQSENNRNRGKSDVNVTGYKGVFVRRNTNSYMAAISVNKKQIYLGMFLGKEEAARAYDEAAKKYFGEFANLNFK